MVGIDFCGRFIDAAMKIQGGKVVQYGSQQVARLPSQALPSRVQLKQVYILLYLVHHLLIYMRIIHNVRTCAYYCGIAYMYVTLRTYCGINVYS